MVRLFASFVAVVLLASCAMPTKYQDIHNQMRPLIGVYVSGEYGYFETERGDIFELRIKERDDQLLLSELAPLREDGKATCLKLKVLGEIEEARGYLNRKRLMVYDIIEAQEFSCSDYSMPRAAHKINRRKRPRIFSLNGGRKMHLRTPLHPL